MFFFFRSKDITLRHYVYFLDFFLDQNTMTLVQSTSLKTGGIFPRYNECQRMAPSLSGARCLLTFWTTLLTFGDS